MHALDTSVRHIGKRVKHLSHKMESLTATVTAIEKRANEAKGKVTITRVCPTLTLSCCPHRNAVAYAIFGRPCGTQRGYCMKLKDLEFTKIVFLSRAN